jgi:hypothetical protein
MPADTSFNDLVRLSDDEMGLLFRDVDWQDVVIALSKGPKELKTKILNNALSERVRMRIEEELAALGPVSASEIQDAQQRIERQAHRTAEKGHIGWPPGKKKVQKQKLSKKYISMKRTVKATIQRPLSQLSYDEINQVFRNLGEIAQTEGILALEEIGQVADDKFMKSAIHLMVDGTEPDLIMDILKTWMNSLLHEQEVKYLKVIEGIKAVQHGDNPRIIEKKLEVLY